MTNMTNTSRVSYLLSAIVVSSGLALAPAAFAQDKMTKDSMSHDTMSKDAMKKDEAMPVQPRTGWLSDSSIARRTSEQTPVIRAIGCRTNRRTAARTSSTSWGGEVSGMSEAKSRPYSHPRMRASATRDISSPDL